jgi:hypothetical protein
MMRNYVSRFECSPKSWNRPHRSIACRDLYDYKIYRPVSPLLTACARRETPQLGLKKFSEFTYTQLANFVDSKLVQAVEVEQPQDPPVPDVTDAMYRLFSANVDVTKVDCSDFKFAMPAEDRPRVVSLLKPITDRIGSTYSNEHQNAFLRSSSPTVLPPRDESPVMPLFPRERIPGRANVPIYHGTSIGLANISALPSLLPDMKVENEEVELLDEHMRVVDGWRTPFLVCS